jgi:hypothetical protein
MGELRPREGAERARQTTAPAARLRYGVGDRPTKARFGTEAIQRNKES